MSRRRMLLGIVCAAAPFALAAIGVAQQTDPFDLLRAIYQKKETQWNMADEALRGGLPGLDPCAAETVRQIQAVRRQSDEALDASVDYYLAWRDRNAAIVRRQASSVKSSAAEAEKIRAELDHARRELASLKKRAADLGELPLSAGRLESLRQLIESVENSQRRWEELLRDLATEDPERRKTVLREESVVASIDGTIRWVKQQREYYDLVYDGRIDASRKLCLRGGRR